MLIGDAAQGKLTHCEDRTMSRDGKERGVALRHYQMPKQAPEPEPCMLAHDLNNCVGIIIGQCELLTDLISNNADAIERVSVISRTARRMANDISARPCPIKF